MKRAAKQPITTDLAIVDGIFVKMVHVPDVYTLIPQHSPTYDHVTALLQGSMLIQKDGGHQMRRAPALITIPAGEKHKFTTLEDDTIFCCIHHVKRAEEPEIAEEHHLELED